MAKKIEITEAQILEIRNLYLKDKLSTRQISKKINLSVTFISDVLKNNEIYINTNDVKDISFFDKGNLKKEINKRKDSLLSQEFLIAEPKENKENFMAICKVTNKEFKDYKNSSGILTEHINQIFPGFVHPSNFIKREYKKNNKKYWHEQYFYIVESTIEEKKKLKCAYCDWTVADLDNKSGWYTTHLRNEHKINKLEKHILKFSNEKRLFKVYFDNLEKDIKLLENTNNFVICKICFKKMSVISNSHLRKHGITQSEYKIKYPNYPIVSEDFINKTTSNFKETSKKIVKSFVSVEENDILLFLRSEHIELKNSDRKLLHGVEIDILCDSKRIGIEYNGNMYHSENFGKKPMHFHLNKTLLMNTAGYSLIHIFEDEWHVKQDIVKSKLKHIFGLNTNLEKIFARKCDIKIINDYEKNFFLNKNHIQGEDKSDISIGAFYREKLVAVMSFDSKRNMNKRINNIGSFELKRFATDNNYVVIGIAGKLLSFFIKNYNPKNIISFADRRWTLDKDNNLYTKLGFTLTNTLKPDYSYYNSKIDRYKRFHKFGFGKNSIKRKFPSLYDENKTEWQMMQEAGYDRIWDCGKFVYELKIN